MKPIKAQLWGAVAVLVASVIAACSGPARPKAAPAMFNPAAWPARLPGRVVPIDAPRGLTGLRFEGLFQPGPTDAERQQVSDALGPDVLPRARFEDDGSFIFRPKPGKAGSGSPDYFVFVSAPPVAGRIPIQRTWFAYHAPAAAPRGIALLMPGLFGTPQTPLDLFTARLHAQGWAVVRMMSQPSRFTERVSYEVDLQHPEAAMDRIAHDTDDRVAECAYSVQAAMAYLEGLHPDLAALPRIAVGMSGGAMTLPTVLACEPDKYTAAVMLAGGCDYFAITRETNYTFLVDSVHYHWSPAEPTPDQSKVLDEMYLARAKLDSFYTAQALRGKPMLMLHADHDGAVPAHLGDLLWERLGKPERWVQTAGHEELFMKVPAQMDRIMAWIDTQSQPPPKSGR